MEPQYNSPPPAYTSTTTTTTTKVVYAPKFDPLYAKTVPGILKIVRMILDLLGFICVMSSGWLVYLSRTSWFSFVSMTGFWVTGVLLMLYFFHIIERSYFLPWMLMESIFCAIWIIFYLIASCLVAAYGFNEAYAAAAFFGFSSMIAYGFDAFLKFKGWRNGQVAQGGSQNTAEVASPTAY